MSYVRDVLIQEVEVHPAALYDLLVLTCRTRSGRIFETVLTVDRAARARSRVDRNLVLVQRMLAVYGIDEADEEYPKASWSRLQGKFFRMKLSLGHKPRPSDANPRPRPPVYIEKVLFRQIDGFDVRAIEDEAIRALEALIEEGRS